MTDSKQTSATKGIVPLAVWPRRKQVPLVDRVHKEYASRQNPLTVIDLSHGATVISSHSVFEQMTNAMDAIHPRGRLVVIAKGEHDSSIVDLCAATIAAARGLGLRYLQHIVVLQCALSDFPVTERSASHSDQRMHDDVLVFAMPEASHA